MTTQLLLVDTPPTWRLDDAARQRGLRGVADARRVLREVDARQRAQRESDQPTDADEVGLTPLVDAA